MLFFAYFFFLFFVSASLEGGLLLDREQQPHIAVDNRVLAQVNGKAISTLDVMKRMDMLFFRQFPEYASSAPARFQFYQINWRPTLQDLIDKELVLADAEENKIPIPAGDVRQEMEEIFGPNVIENLDANGLLFDEAFKMVQNEITIRKMTAYRVSARAVQSITPQALRVAYEAFATSHQRKPTWRYQVITLRNKDRELLIQSAEQLKALINSEGSSWESVTKTAENLPAPASLSAVMTQNEAEMAPAVHDLLATLSAGQFSPPVLQEGRDKKPLIRIFYLHEYIEGGAVPYAEIEPQLKNQLYEEAMARESVQYLTKLRQRFAMHESYVADMVPETFQPFSLK